MSCAFIIPSFNHPHHSGEAIQSLFTQSITPCDIYLIHDGTEKRHRELLIQKFPEIIHLTNEKNSGFTGAVNTGIKEAFKKNYLWFFILSNDALLFKYSGPPKKKGIAAVKILGRNKSSIESIGGVANLLTGKLTHLKVENQNLKKYQKFYVPGAAFFVAREVIEKIGLLDQDLFIYWEDVEYSLRAQKSKVETFSYQNCEVIHKGLKTTRGNPLYTTYYFQRNRKKVCFKYGHFFSKFFFLFYFILEMVKKLSQKNNKTRRSFLWRALFF